MANQNVSGKDAGKKAVGGLLIELEHTAVDGRDLLYRTCKRLLAERDIETTPVLFVRYCVGPSLDRAVQGLLDTAGKKRLSAAKLAEEIRGDFREALLSDKNKPAAFLSKVAEKIGTAGAAIGALTALDMESARKLAAKVGIESERLFSVPASERGFPTADAWLKLAKSMGIGPTRCTVIATSAPSCRSALSAGMSCVAMPDEFTAFQDYGGSDLLVERGADGADSEVADFVKNLLAR